MTMFRMTSRQLVLLSSVFLLIVASAQAAVRLPKMFSHNMVLQRDRVVPIWGWATPGEKVTISFAGQNKTTTTGADGKWRMQLDPLPANKNPQELTVTGENELVVKNVLVGEVWLCAGQTNMAFAVSRGLNFEQEKTEATNSTIRLFRQSDPNEPLPQEDISAGAGGWLVCAPDTVGNFTAVGYFFAREIAKELDMPVGLLPCAAGGAVIEPWINAEGYRLVPELGSLSKMVDEKLPNTELGRPHYQAYLAKMKQWLPVAEAAASAKQMVPLPPTPPWLGDSPELPTKQFNAKVAPLVRYAIRGVLWYQGEGNRHDAELTYFHKMQALIGGWRQVWGQGDFPFYFVQQANVNWSDTPGSPGTPGSPAASGNPAGGGKLVNVREAQRKALTIANTGMAVTIDLGEANDIHPKNKQDVSKRLVLIALARDYQKPVVYSGPLYQRHEIQGNKIRIHFDHAQSGLIVGQKSGLEPVKEVANAPLPCFAIAGSDKIFYWATAVIEGQNVVVSSEKVIEPVAVRYLFTHNPEGVKLYNKEGLPASSFRTDNW